jgi:thiamine-monophosphate kinase
VIAALEGGDDYELLLAVPPRSRGRLAAVRRHVATLPLTRIGVITSGAAVVLRREGRERELPAGYAHFR